MRLGILHGPGGQELALLDPAPSSPAKTLIYFDFVSLTSLACLLSLVALVASCFKAHPQPQVFFFSAIILTSFRKILIDYLYYLDDTTPVRKRTVSPNARLILTRFNENFCSLVTWVDKVDNSGDSLSWADNFPILGPNNNPR